MAGALLAAIGTAAAASKAFVIEFLGGPFIASAANNPAAAQAEIEINANGTVVGILIGSGTTPSGTWATGSGFDIADYDFRMDTISGAPNAPGSDAADTWIPGSTIPRWGVRAASSNVVVFNATLRVRPSGGGADIDTESASMIADNTP